MDYVLIWVRSRVQRLLISCGLVSVLACITTGPSHAARSSPRHVIAATALRDSIIRDTSAFVSIGDCLVQGRFYLDWSEFQGRRLVFQGVVFDSGIEIVDLSAYAFRGGLRFDECDFLGSADFSRSFDLVWLESCWFAADADFHSLDYKKLWVRKCTFDGHANFNGISVTEVLQLSDDHFSKSVTLIGAELDSLAAERLSTSEPIDLRWAQFGPTWLKGSLDELDRRIQEGSLRKPSYVRATLSELEFWKRNFHLLDRGADEKEAAYWIVAVQRRFETNPLNVASSWLLELPSRYGTRPYRPLFISVGCIFVFAILFWRWNVFERSTGVEQARPSTPRPLFALLFSLETFIPFLDITGVRSWGWGVRSEFRWLELSERLLGLVFSALAAYSIGSQF